MNHFSSDILNEILDNELRRGNKIAENTSWPPKCKKLIILEKRFSRKYKADNINYNVINDPHYWYAEYSLKDSSESLACK